MTVISLSRSEIDRMTVLRYGGATGEATGLVGLGANVLFGGSNRTVALQPPSVTGQVGLNVAAGVAELALRPTGR